MHILGNRPAFFAEDCQDGKHKIGLLARYSLMHRDPPSMRLAQRETDTMINAIRLSYRLSVLSKRLGIAARARGRQRRGNSRVSFAAQLSRLEDRCMLSGFVMPVDTVTPPPGTDGTSLVLYDGVTGQYAKQITITNNSTTQTIYPFLEDANSRTALPGDPSPAPTYTGTGMFDPFDAVNQEYRGYIGYSEQVNGSTVNYLGLQPGSSITIDVPLVFWDAGRIIITTDGADLTGSGPNGNPFLYENQNTQATYYGSVSDNTLTFTPEYNSFAFNSAKQDYEPSTAGWTAPTDLTTGMYVSGPGIPANTTITVGSDHNSVTLNPPAGTQITTPAGVTGFTFTSINNGSISNVLRYTQPGYTITNGSSTAANGVVQWYHALTAKNPNNDAPFQLIEMSFRGTFYSPTLNPGTGFNYLIGFDTPTENYISANDFNLVNYDVSYVDSFALPVAMEADSVPIPNTPDVAPFGWVGSSQTIDQVQAEFANFLSGSSSLGAYFDGAGYPSYYAPASVDTTKLPSGQNLFLQSPFNSGSNLSSFADQQTFADGSSVYFPLYALTDGGSGPFSIPAGGATDPNIPEPTANELILAHSSDADQYKLQLLSTELATEQFVVTSSQDGAIPAGTVITSMLKDPVTNQIVGVNLSQPISSANPSQYVYTFSRPTTDPIAAAIASLWYSWASYYANAVAALPSPPPNVAGTLNSNILTLANPTSNIVPGMAVTDAQGISEGVVTAVSSDDRIITLSQVATGAPSDTFNFTKPSVESITGYDPKGLTPIINFTFDSAQQPYARAFAQNIYLVMSTMSRSVQPGAPNASISLLGNIIGGNVGPGFVPNENAAIMATLTNEIKSALRGVPDFTSPLYSNPSQWYPDPALSTGGQNFNVFNLDPFIWFIHEKLGLSAYAFALDDDIGDVGAGGATKLDVSVGGLGGLPTQVPFANTANFGPQHATIAQAPPIGSSVITGLPLAVVNAIAAANFSNNTAGALVNGPGVPIGTTVLTVNSTNGTVTLSAPLTSSPTGPVTYYFFGPVVGTGTVLGTGQPQNTIDGLDMNTYTTLGLLGPLGNIQVTGPGIAPGSTVTVTGLSMLNGVPVVTLSANLDPSQISEVGGSFAYTFGYATLSPISDSGFEQPADVAQLTGGILHGTQLMPSGDQPWTFTDGNATNQIYAGIAGVGSIYTSKNGPPLQGLQVGFIQGNSSISQTVNLAAGTYQISFLAAQSGANVSGNQSLEFLVDGNMVGTVDIVPTNTSYLPYKTAAFTVTSGEHTITFQGLDTGNSTALIDAVAVSPASQLATSPPTGSSPPPLKPPTAKHALPITIEFLSQPGDTVPGGVQQPVLIAVLDKAGFGWSGLTVHAALVRIGPRSRGHIVRRLAPTKTIKGVATFKGLAIKKPGEYELRVVVGEKHLNSEVFEIANGEG
jgi:hypothetical protein